MVADRPCSRTSARTLAGDRKTLQAELRFGPSRLLKPVRFTTACWYEGTRRDRSARDLRQTRSRPPSPLPLQGGPQPKTQARGQSACSTVASIRSSASSMPTRPPSAQASGRRTARKCALSIWSASLRKARRSLKGATASSSCAPEQRSYICQDSGSSPASAFNRSPLLQDTTHRCREPCKPAPSVSPFLPLIRSAPSLVLGLSDTPPIPHLARDWEQPGGPAWSKFRGPWLF